MRIALPCLLLLTACSESFAPPSAVSDFRVVGARIEVQSEPARANPTPGESVQVSLLAVDRGAAPSDIPEVPPLTPPPLQWALVPCIPLPTTIGPPICGTRIEPCEGCTATPPDDPLAAPVLRFDVPSEDELDQADATSVLLQGIVCANGAPSEDAILRFLRGESEDLSPCVGPPTIVDRPIEGRFVTVQIPIERDPLVPNLNPEVMNVLFDGAAWPQPYDRGVPRTAPRRGCEADLVDLSEEQRQAQPRAGDVSSTMDLSVTEGSLQSFTVDGETMTEEIQVSWLADGGAFEVSFAFITDPARSILTQWRPPGSVPTDGQLVRFQFVIRDGRGGSDWVERGLCVLPPESP